MKRGIAFLALLLFLVACAQTTQTTVQPVPSGNAVQITGFKFVPNTLTVKKGDTVTWTNDDDVPHTVTSDSGNELSSSTLANGQSYSHTFNTAGTYTYHCGVHPGMKATIIVS